MKKCFLWTPIFDKSMTQSCLVDSNLPGPLRQRMRLTLIGKKYIFPVVVRLGHPSSPSAILGRIGSIVVLTIKCALRWRIAHVRVEVLKLFPSSANFNSPASIIRKSWISRIKTTVKHVLPDIINFLSAHTMLVFICGGHLSLKTPTTPGFHPAEKGSSCDFSIPAFTRAKPKRRNFSAWMRLYSCITQHGESSEFLPRQIFSSWMDWFTLTVSHIASIPGDVIRAVDGIAPIGGSFILAESNA